MTAPHPFALARRRTSAGAVAGTAILFLFLGAWAAVFLFARGSGSC